MALQLHNSLSRRKEVFVPGDPARVTMYACGPTVYNPPHIGNARAAVVYDVLYRVLQRHYPRVVYARNITDVDDKINLAAREEGVPIAQISERFTAIYHRDMAALGALDPVIEPKATEHIPRMIAMMEKLLASGHAYVAEGHVLFHVPSFAAYGRLAGRTREEMIAGARVEVAPFKRDPADFVMWKPSPDELPGWDSPWGRGRPGWHIECSAMIEQHLGETIDIHGGGNDLKFPHHENEIAQGTCAHGGKLYCRYWVHNGFVEIDSEKMSKSLGNVLLVQNLLQRFPGEAIRLALLKGRYREPIGWSESLIGDAKSQLDRLYGALRRLRELAPVGPCVPNEAFAAAMDDDLNSPQALAVLMELVTRANVATEEVELGRLKAALLGGGYELGILQQDPERWFSYAATGAVDVAKVEALIAARAAARAAKNWTEADRLRAELTALGVVIEDGAQGTTWRTA
ncbi:MAG TPA: cysteine--tRNA ligase [Gammaproteobacteria bacterium]|nr:cysteine--tRNA ligase [Gammaproteobacteria bacterium]